MPYDMDVAIVAPEDRFAHSRALMEMHHHRKQVFVEHLGWQLKHAGSWLEVDDFDNDHAVYLMVCAGADQTHLGSVRLLPTTQPHLLSAVFGSLCQTHDICRPDTWEISRLVLRPDAMSLADRLRLIRLMAAELVQFAHTHAISRYALVGSTERMPLLLSVGWEVFPLSLPTLWEGELIEAAEIRIDGTTLERIAARTGARRPSPKSLGHCHEEPCDVA
jgi:N-acyl-L-homoserine lactone synthetase